MADFLRSQLPTLIHGYNFSTEEPLQIRSFDQSIEVCPNAILCIQRNLFAIEMGNNQNFKFSFLESEFIVLLAAALRRAGVIPPLTQISPSCLRC